MSKPFLLGVLILLSVFLYVTSFALRKQTEPAPPPTPKETEQMQAAKKEEEKVAMRKSMEAQKAAASHYTSKGDDTGPNIKHGQPAAKPPGAPVKDRNMMDIRSDWYRGTPDGEKGVEKEIAYRNTLPAPGSAPPPSAGDPKGAPKGLGAIQAKQ